MKKQTKKHTKTKERKMPLEPNNGKINLKFIILLIVVLVLPLGAFIFNRRSSMQADAAGNQNVVIFGDSIVYGYATKANRWSNIVTSNLKTDKRYRAVTIINRSVPGQSIISKRAKQKDRNGVTIGGELFNHVLATYPIGTSRTRIPSYVVIVPSINEIIVSTQPTPEKNVEYAISGLTMIKQYLIDRGVRNVYITSMLQSSAAWDDTTPQEVNKTINLFNEQLRAKGMLNMSSYNLNLDGIMGSDPTYFIGTDNLHPNQSGHNILAKNMTEFLKLQIK